MPAKKPAKSFVKTLSDTANLGEVPADTFFKDQHPDLKADYIMANPPFNLRDWRGPDTAMRGSANLQPAGTPQVTSEARNKLVHNGRWNGYDTPPTGNANYAWILHMVSKLSDWSGATKTTRQGCPKGERGGANQNGFVLANGSMSTNTKGEGAIRQKLVENDLVDTAPRDSAFPQSEAIPQVVSEAKDNMIALPGQLFYTTQIPVCLWFLTKNKSGSNGAPAPLNSSQKDGAGAPSLPDYRNREGETLFIDARKIGSMISRTQKELDTDDTDDIAAIAKTYHAWRGEKKNCGYSVSGYTQTNNAEIYQHIANISIAA